MNKIKHLRGQLRIKCKQLSSRLPATHTNTVIRQNMSKIKHLERELRASEGAPPQQQATIVQQTP